MAEGFEELVDMAVRTRTAFEPMVDLYARITRSSEQLGISQKQVANVTEITAKAFKSGGASATEQAAGILLLFFMLRLADCVALFGQTFFSLELP